VKVLDRVADSLKPAVPWKWRRKLAWARVSLRGPTNTLRALPDFLIIGAERAGTGSLYRYLGEHPCVTRSVRKEVDYFSRNYYRGPEWYRSHFPLRASMSARALVRGRPMHTFEATGDYIFHPYAAERAREMLPDAKLLVLLRDPVERAFGHYLNMVRLGFEDRSFEEALDLEQERITPDIEMMREDPLYYCGPYYRFSYVTKGLYAEQLERWLAHFPAEQFMVMRNEDLFFDEGSTFEQVLDFLGLHRWRPREFKNFNYSAGVTVPHPPMSPETRGMLSETFAPHDRRLEELLQREFGWQGRSLGWGE
jgi:hypothetical protein